MAAQRFKISTEGSQALVAATAQTVVQLVAPTNIRVKLLGYKVAFNGIAPTNTPVLVELVRQTTAGTSSAGTPVKLDDSLAESIQSTCRKDVTVEPTTTDVLDYVRVHPQGRYEFSAPFGREIICGGGDRLGIRVTAADVVSVDATMECEE